MRSTSLLAVAAALALSTLGSAQTTWYVDPLAPPPGNGTPSAPYASIQYALDQATTVTGDTLHLAPGEYVENLVLSKLVRIEGASGAAVTTLRAAQPGTLVRVSAPDGVPEATLFGVTLDGSAHPDGTGIEVHGSGFAAVRLERSIVRNFTSGRATLVHATSYVDAFQSALVFNGVGVAVAPAVSNGQVNLTGCIARFNTVELSGVIDGYNPNWSAIDPTLLAQGGFTPNNTGADPLVWNVLDGDVHLRPSSPCIDASDPLAPLDPNGSRADIGAFPFDPSYGWTSYCTSGTTTNGCVPVISASGVPSAAATSGFTLTTSGVEGAKQGHLFYGLSGPHAAPWGASSHFLCVKAPSQRTGTQGSGGTAGACDGSIALDWCAYIATHPSALGAPFSAGTNVWAQLFFRDPPSPKTTALSNALSFTVVP